jgi:hypothetical protein
MLQDELEALALFLDKKVYLYQPGWGKDAEKVQYGVLNDTGKEEVHIWYNGHNHYARAMVLE